MVKKLLNKYIPIEYSLATYHRSNQDTCLVNKPVVMEGDWVQSGDLLGDCSASIGGELAIGQNILVAYMPWEGYNYEDAILISERLVYDDLYTSVHIERYEIETKETKQGSEQITREIPDVNEQEISHLDKNGIAKIGSWIQEGTILVGKITPTTKKNQSTYQKLLYSLLEKEFRPVTDSSLRAPKGIKAKVLDVQILNTHIITKKESKKRTNMPAKAYTKKSNSYEMQYHPEGMKRNPEGIMAKPYGTLRAKGIQYYPEGMIYQGIAITETHYPLKGPSNVHIYLAEKRKLQIGDKMAGRHGNKGIVSQILPRQDMPYLPNGVPIDIVLNPLGVPSRMNVGQIYECLLGLAGKHLGEHFKIAPFDEIYGPEASRSFVYSKLYEARKKSGLNWLFNPNSPGKMRLFDGRTGDSFDQPITVGMAYMLKLVHMVDDKLHMRSTGPYSLVTQQPLRGRSSQGGQRVGEMEVWAIEGYGAAFVLLEMLTIKSDDLTGRLTLWSNLILNREISIGTPESFKVLICELKALCLDMGLFRSEPNPHANMGKTQMGDSVKENKTSLQKYTEIKNLMELP